MRSRIGDDAGTSGERMVKPPLGDNDGRLFAAPRIVRVVGFGHIVDGAADHLLGGLCPADNDRISAIMGGVA